MAAATSIILGATALASTGMGIAKSVKEAKMAKEAQREIDNYERQEVAFNNTLAAIDVPTEQYVQNMKRIQQQSADYAAQAASGGARGLAMLPSIQENLYAQEDQVVANFQNQLYDLRRQAAEMQAQQDMAAFQARESREQRELAGYGAMYEAGRQGMYGGIGDALQGVTSIAGQAAGWDINFGRQNEGFVPQAEADTTGMRQIAYDSNRKLTDSFGNSYVYNERSGYQMIPQQQSPFGITPQVEAMRKLNFNNRK